MKRTISLIMISLIAVSMFSTLAPQAKCMYASVVFTVFDEAGFPPPSSTGAKRLADIPVDVYTLGGVKVAGGLTGSTGEISFNLPLGIYNITYGGKMITPYESGAWYGITSKIVFIFIDPTYIDLYAPVIIFHSYSGGNNFELNCIDLDRVTSTPEDVITVAPGQEINAEFSWWELETHNVPVWYVSAFGSWNPTSALGNLASGVASPSTHNLHTVPLTFAAPNTPGTYEVRLIGVEDYDWPNSYYTSFHYQPSLGRDTCNDLISKNLHGPYGTSTIIVKREISAIREIITIPDSAPPLWTLKDGDVNGDGKSDWRLNRQVDDQDNSIELWVIDPLNGSPYYSLVFIDNSGHKYWIGKCVWGHGRNSGIKWHTGDLNNNGNPDLFLRTEWMTLDGPDENPIDRKTDGLEKSPPDMTYDDDKDGLTDVWEYLFDVETKKLTLIKYHRDPEIVFVQTIDPPSVPFDFGDLPPADPTGTGVIGHPDGMSLPAASLWTHAHANIDFDPNTLNLVSKGERVTCRIELPGFNVSDIDFSAILLNETILVDSSALITVEDHDNDTIPDLMVNFNRTAVSEFILSEGVTHGNVTLALTGKLYDDTPFKGDNIIKVSDLAGDLNCDGIVNIQDVLIAALAFGTMPGDPNWNPDADLDSNGIINILDLVIIGVNFGKTW